MMEKTRPAILSDALRVLPVAFAATVNVTTLLPTPLVSDVIVTQLALLFTFQTQPAEVVTEMLPVPPNVTKF